MTAVSLLAVTLVACSGKSSMGHDQQAASQAPAAASNGPQSGGSLTVAYKDDLATLDPAIGYDWANWPAEKMVFDGLLDYDKTTNLEPRVADGMPQVSPDAKVYTFTLKKGVKFHNGRELKADDAAYTITRVLDPKTKSPGRAIDWYSATLGFDLRWRSGNYAALNVSETPLTLYEPDDFRPVENVGFNFYVTDIEAAHRKLEDAGCEASDIQEGGGVRFFDFKDPDGNALSVCWFPE